MAATIDVPTFLLHFPEFNDAPATLVAAKLDEARTMVPVPPSPTVWNADGDPARDLTQMGTFLYCAHFLFESPYARHMARTDDKGAGGSPYKARLDNLKRIITSGYRVT